MKPIRTILLFSLVTFYTFTLSAQESNLAPNPGFETDPLDDYWTLGDGIFDHVDVALSGNHSLRITRFENAADPYARLVSKTSRIPLPAGTGALYLRVHLRGKDIDPEQVQLALNFWDETAENTVGSTAHLNVSPTTTWNTFLLQTSSIPGDASYVRFEVRFKGVGKLWIDDISLTVIDRTQPQNLLPNPGFETDPYLTYLTFGEGRFEHTSEAFTGGYAVKIERDADATDRFARWVSKTRLTPIPPGTDSLHFSVMLRGENIEPDGAQIALNFWGVDETIYLGGVTPFVTPNDDWTQFSVISNDIPADAGYVRVEVRLRSSGRLWADDLVLTGDSGGSPGSPPADGGPSPYTSGDYYVAPNGSDQNSGSKNRPFETIQHALDTAVAGDIILVREGVYHEVVTFEKPGAPNAPIVLAVYPGETAVIDGEYTRPPVPPSGWVRCSDRGAQPSCFHYNPLVEIAASHIVLYGFDIRHSLGRAVWVHNPDRRIGHIKIINNSIHDNRNAGIKLYKVDHVLVEGNRVWHSSNYATHSRPNKELGWTHAVNAIRSNNITYRNNEIFQNYGEGLGTGRGSWNVVVQNNVLYDNKALQLYVHRSHDVLVERNVVYCTGDPEFNRGTTIPPAIVINNESQYNDRGLFNVDEVLIRNNLVVGCSVGFSIWGGGGEVKNGSRDVTVMHNTFVNLRSGSEQREPYVFTIIGAPDHDDIVIRSNLIYQSNPLINVAGNRSEVKFLNNAWLEAPPPGAASASDIIGNLNLRQPEAAVAAGQINANHYGLRGSSHAIGQATSENVCCDFFENSRDTNPDIGFYEFTP